MVSTLANQMRENWCVMGTLFMLMSGFLMCWLSIYGNYILLPWIKYFSIAYIFVFLGYHNWPGKIYKFISITGILIKWYYRVFYDNRILYNARKFHVAQAKLILNIKFDPDYYFEASFNVPADVNLMRLKNITRDYCLILEFIQKFGKFNELTVDQQFLLHRIIILICTIWISDKDYFWILFKQHYDLTRWGVVFMEAEADYLGDLVAAD